MAAAGITGKAAMPKGLRHGFGVKAFQSNVPPHLVQRWLGHASLKTTAIYGDVIGPEERAFAARMWGMRDEPRRAARAIPKQKLRAATRSAGPHERRKTRGRSKEASGGTCNVR